MVTSRIFPVLVLLVLLALLACAAAPRASAQSLRVTWSPERPVVGTRFVVRVEAPLGATAARPASLTGRFADEPLHFQDGDSVWSWSVAAVPIDARGSLELALDVRWADGTIETITR